MNSKRSFFLVYLVFVVVSFVSFAGEFSIMSFNIQGHGPGSSSHRVSNTRWVDQIVQVIKMSKADIVLLQEVPLDTSNNLLKSLVLKLNKKGDNWNFCSSVKYAKCNMDLNNAILYNAKNVTLKKDLAYSPPFNFVQYYESTENDPRRYQFVYNNVQVIEFAHKDKSSQSFYVVNVHLPGPNDQEKVFEERRILELLYADYKRKKPLIIAGDFNIRRSELKRGSNFSDAIIDGNEGRYIDDWGQKTTLSKSTTAIILKNDYDHFIVNKNSLFYLSEQMRHVFTKNKVEKYDTLSIGKEKYSNSFDYMDLSDHMPIMIRLKFY